jgi:hypothetical protein
MAVTLHVNGAAVIFTGTGASSALEELGVSVDGVTIKETLVKEPVMIDTYYKTPYDFQYSLSEVLVTCDLVAWDDSVLNKVLGRLVGTSPLTPGTFGSAGSLIVAGGYTTRLLIKSTPTSQGVTGSEACHNFPLVFLDDAAEAKLGTERTIWKLQFRAMPSQNLTATNGVVLWNTTCT